MAETEIVWTDATWHLVAGCSIMSAGCSHHYAATAAYEELGWQAGALQATTAPVELSLGDRFCLALAQRPAVPAYTAHRAWKEVAAEAGAKVVAIR